MLESKFFDGAANGLADAQFFKCLQIDDVNKAGRNTALPAISFGHEDLPIVNKRVTDNAP